MAVVGQDARHLSSNSEAASAQAFRDDSSPNCTSLIGKSEDQAETAFMPENIASTLNTMKAVIEVVKRNITDRLLTKGPE